jgi:hypothetical protein
MRHFLFEDKEYRINPYFKRRKKEQDSAAALARLIRRLTPRSRRGSDGSRPFRGKGVDARQNCMVKMQYSNSIEAHRVQLEKYLVREGTDIDGSGAKLYGTDLEEYRQNMDKKNIRIFLSPQSDKINLTGLAEQFIKKLEQQTGYTLYWQAANHYNTAHPHAHLLINGMDRNGREVDIPRDIVKTFMREYAKDICTSQIGNRTNAEIAIEKEKELEARRFTKLDKKIKELGGDSLKVYTNQIYSDRERVLARLENLRKLGMCAYDKGAYRLSPQWEENLKANARYNTFLTARSELKYADPSKLKVYTGEDGAITGKVTKIYKLEEDASDNHAVVIESLDGKSAYFVPLFKKPEMFFGKGKSGLLENDVVSIEAYKTQKGRLTPLIFKDGVSQSYKEFVKNNHSGVTVSQEDGKHKNLSGI